MKVPVKIPTNVEILIQTGQNVDFKTPFIQKKGQKRIEIPLSKMLQFEPAKIFLSLKKVIGDTVKKGELVAENKSMFSSKQYLSEVDGIIVEVNHNLGSIILELDSDDAHVVNCFFAGEVEAIHDDHLEIRVKKVEKFDTENVLDHYVGAEIYYLPENSQYSEEDIEGKYIFVSDVNPLDHIKIEALGAHGYITNSKKSLQGAMKQIVIENSDHFEHIARERYPFCIVSPDNRSIFVYES